MLNWGRLFFTFCASILLGLHSVAQQGSPGIMVGNVLDSLTQQPIPSATITFFNSKSDSLRFTTLTDANGYFEKQQLPFGWYSIRITNVGYASLVIDSIHLREDRFDFNLGDIKLFPSAEELETVIVFAEKALIEQADGKIIYNAGESALNAGNTTADMLRNLPLISADGNGKLLMRGKEPKILIDEKPVDLNNQQLQELLESLPGHAIERIELIQNPSPDLGTDPGGVINIVTRKGKVGFTGRASITGGTRGELNSGISLNYRGTKWNIQSSVNLVMSKLPGYNESTRNNLYNDSSNQFLTRGDFNTQSTRPNIRFQADYNPDKLKQWSFVLQASGSSFNSNSLTTYSNLNQFGELWRLSKRNIISTGDNWNFSPQISYQWKSAKRSGENLRFIASSGISGGNNEKQFRQQFLNPKSQETITPDSLQLQQSDNTGLSAQLRFNYNRPIFKKKFTLNTGASYQYTKSNSLQDILYRDVAQNQWVPNQQLATDFDFIQHITTVRAGFTWNMGNGYRLIPYLQYEFTRFNINLFDSLAGENNYSNAMPGVTLRKDFNKSHQVNLVYRTTLRRPGSGELSPAIDFSDPFNLRFGNPALLPSYGHQFDLNYNYTKGNRYVNVSLGYNLVDNITAQVRSLQGDGRTFLVWQNIAERTEYEVSVFSGYTFSKLYRLNGSAGYTYISYGEALKERFRYRDGQTYFATLNNSFYFSPVFSFDANLRFNTTADPQGRSRSNVNTSFALQRKFFERRLVVSIGAVDPFTPQQYTTTTTGRNFNLNALRSNRTRNYRVTLAWQLNKMVKAPKKKTGNAKSTKLNK